MSTTDTSRTAATITLVARGAVAAVLATVVGLGGAQAFAATTPVTSGAGITLTSATMLLPAHNNGAEVQKVVDAGIAAKQARDKANAVATALGTARGVLDGKRADLAVAQRNAQAAQTAVDSQQATTTSAEQAFTAAATAKKTAAAAFNADVNNPVREAEYNIRNQTFLERLRDFTEAGRRLDQLKKDRDAAKGVVGTKTSEVAKAQADVTAAQTAATTADAAAVKAEKTYNDLLKSYGKKGQH